MKHLIISITLIMVILFTCVGCNTQYTKTSTDMNGFESWGNGVYYYELDLPALIAESDYTKADSKFGKSLSRLLYDKRLLGIASNSRGGFGKTRGYWVIVEEKTQ